MNNRKLKITIIGGGNGGLTTAIALQQKGFKPTIFERAPELKPVGAGIVLSSNAMNALDQLGLASKVYHSGTPAKSYTIQTDQAKVLRTVEI